MITYECCNCEDTTTEYENSGICEICGSWNFNEYDDEEILGEDE